MDKKLTDEQRGVLRLMKDGAVIVSPVDGTDRRALYTLKHDVVQYKERVPERVVQALLDDDYITVRMSPGRMCNWNVYEYNRSPDPK